MPTCPSYISRLVFLTCYLMSVFVSRKDLHIPHESIFVGEGRYPGRRSRQRSSTNLQQVSCSLHVPLCHSSSGIVREELPVQWRWGVVCVFVWLCVDEELEKEGVVREEESGRVRLYSAAHSRPVVHERRSPENSSCSAL